VLQVPGISPGLVVDDEIRKILIDSRKFHLLHRDTDENEHSLEMHLPYLAHVFRAELDRVRVVPILMGALSKESEIEYGEILAPYLKDPENLFIVSSDFCHWGERFRYTRYNPSAGPIWQSIEDLDREGMRFIEAKDADGFHAYQRSTGNTICGRHPIAVLLRAIQVAQSDYSVRFVRYAQSSKCTEPNDSSVSYASAWVRHSRR